MASRSRTRTYLEPSQQHQQRIWRRFQADDHGAVALIFALAGTVLLGLVGGGHARTIEETVREISRIIATMKD